LNEDDVVLPRFVLYRLVFELICLLLFDENWKALPFAVDPVEVVEVLPPVNEDPPDFVEDPVEVVEVLPPVNEDPLDFVEYPLVGVEVLPPVNEDPLIFEEELLDEAGLLPPVREDPPELVDGFVLTLVP
jgi:hypothetical protein